MPRSDSGGGGGYEGPDRGSSEPSAWDKMRLKKPKGKKKTKDFDYKGGAEKEFKAGANVIDPKTGKVAKRGTFDEHLSSTGNRADDPRNWEFHYKAPRTAYSMQGKNDNRVDNQAKARRAAQYKADREGKEVYSIQKLEYETTGITRKTDESRAKRKAVGGGRFSSTSGARNVAAQRQTATRKRGRSAARSPGAFDEPASKRGGIA